MRAFNDGILVGSGTVNNDDPSLLCRLERLEDRSPTRIVLDRRLQMSGKSQLLQTANKTPTIVATSSGNGILLPFQHLGVSVISLAGVSEDQQLFHVVKKLGNRGISTLLVEGGALVAAAFLKAQLVDRLVIFQSDKNLSGIERAVYAPITPQNMSDNFVLKNWLTFGSDIMYEYGQKDR